MCLELLQGRKIILEFATVPVFCLPEKNKWLSDQISVHKAWNDRELLSLVASAESKSASPSGKAIVVCAKEKVQRIEKLQTDKRQVCMIDANSSIGH